MQIPESFKKILELNQLYYGIVFTTLSNYESIITDKKPEFFPDYTDHGVKHIEKVLLTAEWLIGESISMLNDKDITVLILSVLLHDYGMFISREGLETLLFSEISDEDFDNRTWGELWEEYKDDVRRWDEKKQIIVAGKLLDELEIELDEDMKTSTRKIIGEFLRWHHPRIGFEIAKYGFPGANKQRIKFAEGLEEEIKELAGLVARSHGLELRDTFQFLDEKYYDLREPFSVKAVYLMVLIRISDYLQITSERANKSEFLIRNISSPFSRLQWNIHNAIKNINVNNEDPELIKIVASPKTSEEYLELRKLFKGIQSELDTSWAVLGELFGENRILSDLSVKIRRVRSNIEDKKYIDGLPYLPTKVSFQSHPEIMKLLIHPLYGSNPTFGIRELLQNAIDACRERFEKEKGKREHYEPLINLCIEQRGEECYFVIKDNGLGMSQNSLVNYFLKAGSTYRKSTEWRKDFCDENGQSKIQRSGKFGVGVLAAFLLGDEIYVETKKEGAEEGYYFNAKLDDDIFEIKKKDLDVGTLIEIKMKKEAIESLRSDTQKMTKLSWFNWYKFSSPKIIISVPSGWRTPRVYDKEINIDNFQIDGWYRFQPEKFYAVDWTYKETQQLLCNGIVVPEYSNLEASYPSLKRGPAISVLDRNGLLPLSLNRNQLNEQLPFSDELIKEICKQILWEFLQLPELDITDLEFGYIGDKISLKHEALSARTDERKFRWGEGDLLLTKKGYIIPHSYCIGKYKLKKIVALWVKGITSDILRLIPFDDEKVAYSVLPQLDSRTSMKNRLYENTINFNEVSCNISNKKIYLPISDVTYLTGAKRRLAQWFKDSTQQEQVIHGWTCLNVRNPALTDIYENELSDLIQMVIEYNKPFLIKNRNSEKKDIMGGVLSSYMGDSVVIPYKMKERQELFPRLFDELSKFK